MHFPRRSFEILRADVLRLLVPSSSQKELRQLRVHQALRRVRRDRAASVHDVGEFATHAFTSPQNRLHQPERRALRHAQRRREEVVKEHVCSLFLPLWFAVVLDEKVAQIRRRGARRCRHLQRVQVELIHLSRKRLGLRALLHLLHGKEKLADRTAFPDREGGHSIVLLHLLVDDFGRLSLPIAPIRTNTQREQANAGTRLFVSILPSCRVGRFLAPPVLAATIIFGFRCCFGFFAVFSLLLRQFLLACL
mmetsp:Transcript_18643/g.46542  ORF Transcript_18643/g.46542 Transcript_18643/m.46542 type:complete len:250 (+) Transcript_18643:776-1525(+)